MSVIVLGFPVRKWCIALVILFTSTASAHVSPLAAQTALPAWVQSDPATKTVTLQLDVTPAADGGAALLAGARNGGVQVVVPMRWTVTWRFRNLDSARTHSLVIMAEREKLPQEAGPPAFPQAATRLPLKGLPAVAADARPQDVTTFEADQAGWYWLLDGVPGQAIAGTFIGLKVDPAATAPAVVVKTP